MTEAATTRRPDPARPPRASPLARGGDTGARAEPASRRALSGAFRGAGIHLALPDDRSARLRAYGDRLHPADWLVESKSLKLYLAAFRNHGAFHEACTMAIARRLMACRSRCGCGSAATGIRAAACRSTCSGRAARRPRALWVPAPGGATLSWERMKRGCAILIRERDPERAFGSVSMRSASRRLNSAQRPRERLDGFLEAGQHGDMGWLADRADAAQQAAAPLARGGKRRLARPSLRAGRGPLAHPGAARSRRHRRLCPQTRLSDVVKAPAQGAGRSWPALRAGVKVFVDTAPVTEKPLAQRAGSAGRASTATWSRARIGSWLFLGEISPRWTCHPTRRSGTIAAPATAASTSARPAAFPAPYRLDARRCISYLTIEHTGPIPEESAPRWAIASTVRRLPGGLPLEQIRPRACRARLRPARGAAGAELAELAALDDAGFRALFSGSAGQAHRPRPLRSQRDDRGRQFRRPRVASRGTNALTGDADPVVAEAARWAVLRLEA